MKKKELTFNPFIHRTIESIAAKWPENIAIEGENERWTFSQLNERANMLTSLLGKDTSISGKIVCVVLPSGYDLIASMLATFKSNGIYLAIDDSLADKRINEMLLQSPPDVFITDVSNRPKLEKWIAQANLSDVSIVEINEDGNYSFGIYSQKSCQLHSVDHSQLCTANPEITGAPDDANYIFYTSGSTGKPKAILGKTISLSHFMDWQIREFVINENDRYAQFSPITFDAYLSEVLSTLCTGATLVIPPEQFKVSISKFVSWLDSKNITILEGVPSLLRSIANEIKHEHVENCDLKDLRLFLLAGEMLFTKDIKRWRDAVGDHAMLVNTYGATETTVIRTFHKVGEISDDLSESIPVGKPINDSVVAVINDNRICRNLEIGEVYVKTPYATKGYYENQKQTDEIFVQNPVNEKRDIVYKTGDLGYFNKNKELVITGRIDRQIKIHGVRVELNEIESGLLSMDDVSQCLVIKHTGLDDQEYLVAYYTGSEVLPDVFSNELRKTLNSSIIPSFFVFLEEFPLNKNGKIDVHNLPLPEDVMDENLEYTEPVGKTEKRLEEIWSEILKIERVSRDHSFFHVGGHSLRTMQLISRIEKYFGVALKAPDIFESQTIEEQAKLIEASERVEYDAIGLASKMDSYPLSPAQKRLWVLDQLQEKSQKAYTIQMGYELDGPIDVQAIGSAVKALIQRHEVLRTIFKVEKGEPRQFVQPIDQVNDYFEFQDLDTSNSDSIDAESSKTKIALSGLSTGPLFRVLLSKTSTTSHDLTLVIHHIISDAWSLEVMINELMDLYFANVTGKGGITNELAIQYKDYTTWQLDRLQGNGFDDHRNFWHQLLETPLPILQLPTDHARPTEKSYKGGIESLKFNKHQIQGLKEITDAENTSLFVGLLSLVHTFLYHITYQSDQILGIPVSGRNRDSLEGQIGFYVNTLPLRTTLEANDGFQTLLQKVNANTLNAFAHEEYPFDYLVNELNLERDTSHHPLFDVMVLFQNDQLYNPIAVSDYGDHGVSCKPVKQAHNTSKFDLTFAFFESEDELYLNLEYSKDLFETVTAKSFIHHIGELVDHIIATPDQSINKLSCLSQGDIKQQTEVLNDTQVYDSSYASISENFDHIVATYPDAIAISYQGKEYTYSALDAHATYLASQLIGNYKVQTDQVVTIFMDRSDRLIISMLAAIKIGAVYSVFDKKTPVARLSEVIRDNSSRVLVTDEALIEISDVPVLQFNESFHKEQENAKSVSSSTAIGPDNCVSLIYTSGSTGKPKAVEVTNRGLLNYASWFIDSNEISTDDLSMLLSSASFDLCYTSIWPVLLAGGTLIVLPELEIFDPEIVTDQISREQVTYLKMTPSHFNALVRSEKFRKGNHADYLKLIVIGGEKIKSSDLQRFYEIEANRAITFLNHYGPTEATVGVVTKKITFNDLREFKEEEPIGKPIRNTQVYILNDEQNLVPVGVTGEIGISGQCLAKGYFQSADETALRFVEHPFIDGQKLYLTGDLGKLNRKGDLVIVGRKDDQVKIRGFRVEPAEVQCVLLENELILDAVAIAEKGDHNETHLVGYYVGEVEQQEVRDHLKAHLPDYMIPPHLIQMDKLPVNSNGKVNRGLLPKYKEVFSQQRENEYVAPATKIQEVLCNIWEKVLHRDQVGVKDNFFELGGHSLTAVNLVSEVYKALSVQLNLATIFKYPTVSGLANEIAKAAKTTYENIPITPEAENYALSYAQRRLWVINQMEGRASSAYTIQYAFELSGDLDAKCMAEAFYKLVERHESLRTVLVAVGEEPRQVVLAPEECNFSLAFEDLQGSNKEVEIQELLSRQAHHSFDLGKGPLFNPLLVAVAPRVHILSISMHHIISDAFSMQVIYREIIALYNHLATGEPLVLTPLPIQFKDYAVWENNRLDHFQDDHLEYWIKQFKTEVPPLELPSDFVRPSRKDYQGEIVEAYFNETDIKGLRQLCNQSNASLYIGLVACVRSLLSRYTGQQDIVIGIPISGRMHEDLTSQIGFFINTLAIRNQVNIDSSFLESLEDEKAVFTEAYDHQDLPFDQLVEALDLNRDPGRNPLFDVMVIMQNEADSNLDDYQIPGVEISQYEVPHTYSKFDLVFSFFERDQTIGLKLEYSSQLFTSARMQQLLDHLQQLLRQLVVRPNDPLHTVKFLGSKEEAALLELNPPSESLREETLIELWAQQVRLQPDSLALITRDARLTYRELEQNANEIAHFLVEKYQVAHNQPVALMMSRGPLMVATILGILKTGAYYIPVDPSHPTSRIQYMLQNASAGLLLVDDGDMGDLDADRAVVDLSLIQDELATYPHDEIETSGISYDLAYVMYTSGSTGKPKGVMVSHSSVVNFLKSMFREPGIDKEDKLLAVTTYIFDISVLELFLPLTSGAVLALADEEMIKSPNVLMQWMEEQDISIMQATPTFWQMLLTAGWKGKKGLKVLSGGEALLQSVFTSLQDKVEEVWNMFGPTETTIWSTLANLTHSEVIHIGTPIDNTEIYVLDPYMNLQPMGIPGELYIGGKGVAKGYLNQEELTTDRFIQNPFKPEGVLYRTGDLCEWSMDGHLLYHGRIDQQVKIRGHRIEIGEIESELLSLPAIDQVAVVVQEKEDNKSLIAFLSVGSSFELTLTRDHLGNSLPTYMIPEHFVILDQLPMTQNGKVDRKQLMEKTPGDLYDTLYVAPANKIQEDLISIWKRVLDVDQMGITHNFFLMGGNSLKAIRIISMINKQLGYQTGLSVLFDYPTIKAFSEKLGAENKGVYEVINVIPEDSDYPVSYAQRRFWLINQVNKQELGAYNISECYKIKGELDRDVLEQALIHLKERHESLRTIFKPSDDGVRQVILPMEEVDSGLQVHNMEGLDVDEPFIKEMVQSMSANHLDLQEGPLFHFHWIKLNSETHVFVMCIHHIISDAWSLEVLTSEFLKLYNALLKSEQPDLTELPFQYKDYAAWQNKQLSGQSLQSHKDFWLQYLGGELPILDLPTDFERPLLKSFEGSSLSVHLDSDLTSDFKAYCQDSNISPFMGLLTLVHTLIYRYTGQEDQIVGSPVSGRHMLEMDNQVGLFVNTLPLKNSVEANDSFDALAQRVKSNVSNAFEHQAYPFDLLVEDLSVERDLSRNPVFDVMVQFEDEQVSTTSFDLLNETLEINSYDFDRKTTKFDLTFAFYDRGSSIKLIIEYNTDLFSSPRIKRMSEHLLLLLEGCLKKPDQSISHIDYFGKQEADHLLKLGQGIKKNRAFRSVVQLFEDQVTKSPDAIALNDTDGAMSFAELNNASNQLAHKLISTYETGPTSMVGVRLDRSRNLIIGILGILKTGGSYLALDPNLPEGRLNFMMDDADLKVILVENNTDLHAETGRHSITQLAIDDISDQPVDDCSRVDEIKSEDLCYTIYTSGTTGQPKGVQITHAGLSNYVQWAGDAYLQDKPYHFSLFTSLSFDLSLTSLWLPLINGHKLWLEAESEPLTALTRVLKNDEINILKITPSHLKVMMEEDLSSSNLEVLIVGGEQLNVSQVEQLTARFDRPIRIFNEYGPTETVVGCMIYQYDPAVDKNRSVAIGSPIDNTDVYLLDDQMKPVGIGIKGEIYVGGVGLALGYLKQPELTNEKFVDHPFAKGRKLYKTGDIGFWSDTGVMYFIGRSDNQLKINGYRVETAEIEQYMLKMEELKNAVVTSSVKKTPEPILTAYYISDQELNKSQITSFLGSYLPSYMIPKQFLRLEELPLTAHGKVDYDQLPSIEEVIDNNSHYVAPVSEVEARLAEIWEQVLSREKAGVEDDFFELGGDSIKALQISAKMRKAGYKLDVKDIFIHRTIREAADYVQEDEITNLPEEVPQGSLPLTPIQHAFFARELAIPTYYNHSILLQVPVEVSESDLKTMCKVIINHHDALRMDYAIDGDDVSQSYGALDKPMYWKVIDLRDGKTALEDEVLKIQTDYRFNDDPIIRFGYILTNDGARLIIVVHHLVIDGVSWRILVEDFNDLYRQLLEKSAFKLPRKSHSFQAWALFLEKYAKNETLLSEIPYWNEVASKVSYILPSSGSVKTKNVAAKEISIKLDENTTKTLLTSANKTFNTSTNDLLLAALGMAIHQFFDEEDPVIMVEGHGRDFSEGSLNVARTIGWFTTVYPIILPSSDHSDMASVIKNTKENLRNIPNKGIGYGVLKYLADRQEKELLALDIEPEIIFNYLGQFDGDFDQEGFRRDSQKTASNYDSTDRLEYPLEIAAFVFGGRITFAFDFDINAIPLQYIKEFSAKVKHVLEELVAYCEQKEDSYVTPSDLTYQEFTVDELENFFE